MGGPSSASSASSGAADPELKRLRKFGTKLGAIALQLREIKQKDSPINSEHKKRQTVLVLVLVHSVLILCARRRVAISELDQDGLAKCIVFCQWESLLQKIAAAFKAFGIRYARLHGSVYARTRTLANFKSTDSEVDVLLLSLEQSASGTNLTCHLAAV